MTILKLKRTKLASALTSVDPTLPTSVEDQRKVVANWSTKVPKVLVAGPEDPGKANGLRHVKTGVTTSVVNLLGNYMQSMPGSEICMLANPDVLITGDVLPILAHVDAQRLDMAWACHLSIGSAPRAFIMSAPVIAHIMNDIDPRMTFAHDWRTWLHAWMVKLLRQRYFDASPFNVLTELPLVAVDTVQERLESPVLNAYDPPAEPTKPKRGNVRKVKVNR